MKKTIIIFVVLLLLAGCEKSAPLNTDEPEPIQRTPISAEPEPAPSIPIDSEPDTPDPEMDTYSILQEELERNITLMETAPDSRNYAGELISVFTEMLNHRQSLEDFDESMSLVNDGGYSAGWIDIWPVYSCGETNYRILKLRTNTVANEKMYVQIYNDDYFGSQWIYEYQNEGSTKGEIAYCGFIQDNDKEYLIIIHEETGNNTDNSYYLVNYEVNGYELSNYSPLLSEYTDSKWIVREDVYPQSELKRAEITTKISKKSSHNRQCAFDYNIFTIYLNNEDLDELSLVFYDGLWETDTYSPHVLTRLKEYYNAMNIAAEWLDEHAGIYSYTIRDDSFLPYEIPPPTYFLFGVEYYEFCVSFRQDEGQEYSQWVLVPAEAGELLVYHYDDDVNASGQQRAVIVEKIEDWYNDNQTVYPPALITVDEALSAYDAWTDEFINDKDYPAKYPLSREPYGMYVVLGEQYYYFRAEEDYNYWYNILVHMETGELLFLLITDGMYREEYIMTMDAWMKISS